MGCDLVEGNGGTKREGLLYLVWDEKRGSWGIEKRECKGNEKKKNISACFLQGERYVAPSAP